ncbi:MAG: hypothetical protein KDD34_03560 [Bdellovibrionales bacterium]|nr:hypothetical protein [Bdellovibrionales bacterium]
MRLKTVGFIFSIFIYSSLSLANQEAFNDFPSSIPLDDDRGVATDLLTPEGDPLFPEDANQYKDLSQLDPASSDIWNKTPMPNGVPTLPLNSSDEKLEWVGEVNSAITWMTFLSEKKGQTTDTASEFYQITLSRKAHSILIRAQLLQKLGYRVPPIKYLRHFRLTFPSKGRRDDFLNQMMIDKLDATPDRWVKNIVQTVAGPNDAQPGKKIWKVTKKTDDCLCLEVQDAVAFYSTSHMYNLSVGADTANTYKDRRVFEALLVPYGLTYVDESFNMLSWQLGRVINNRLYLDYEFGYEFFPNYHDARWIARKILKLSRKDWKEIVRFGAYPKAVELLATEKLISRRNDLIGTFRLQNEFRPISFDPNISYEEFGSKQLVNGKLIQLQWPGYAPHFGYGDPESPLSTSEMFGFLRSKVYSNVISNFITEFNTRFMPSVNLSNKIAEKNYNLLLDALIDSAVNGKAFEIPFGYYTIPYAGINLIASREIVAGQILGTENPIQMSHTIGFSVNAGEYIGFHGLPGGLGANARLQGAFTRTYSHLKPVTNIKTALKQPYRNIAVHLLAKDIGKTVERVAQGEFDNLENLKGPEKEKLENELLDLVGNFKSNFAVGESLIISDYIGASAEASFFRNIDTLTVLDLQMKARAYLDAKAERKLISRLHIFRKDENTIQIYDDKGRVTQLSVNLGIDLSGAKFINLELFNNFNGSAETKYSQLNIDTSKGEDRQLKNTGLISNLKILYSLISNFNKESLYARIEPTIISHEFNEKGTQFRLFWWETKFLKSLNDITIQYAGEVGHFIRAIRGFRSGTNWEGFGVNATNAVVNELLQETDINIASTSGSDPGYTYKGKSRSRRLTYEAQIIKDRTARPFVQVEHRWRGWSANKKQLDTILDEVNNTYPIRDGKPQLYRQLDLKDVTKLQLYSVYLTLNIYQEGIVNLSRVPYKEIKAAFERAAAKLPNNYSGFRRSGDNHDYYHREERQNWVLAKMGSYQRIARRLNKAIKSGNLQAIAKERLNHVELLEKYLLWKDLFQFLGGSKNIFVQSRIVGFREGDEGVNANSGLHSPFLSNSYGMIGSLQPNGPVSFVRENLGLTEAEMFIYWIMETL